MIVDKKGILQMQLTVRVTFGFSLLCSCDPKVNALSRI